MMKFSTDHLGYVICTPDTGRRIASPSVEANLMFAILTELKAIREKVAPAPCCANPATCTRTCDWREFRVKQRELEPAPRATGMDVSNYGGST